MLQQVPVMGEDPNEGPGHDVMTKLPALRPQLRQTPLQQQSIAGFQEHARGVLQMSAT